MREFTNQKQKGFNMIDENQMTRNIVNAFRYLEEECSMKMLWKSVICQAIFDSTSGCTKIDSIEARLEATQWLLGDSESFKEVCELAGFSPEIVQMNVRVIIKNYNPDT